MTVLTLAAHSDLILHAPEVTKSGKDIFGIDNVTVSFEWTQGDGISYSVTAIPLASVRFRGSRKLQLQ